MTDQHLTHTPRSGGRRRQLHAKSVCSLTPSLIVSLPAQLTAARLARRFLDEHWCLPHSSADLDQAHLLVSELVTNAVRHGGWPITFGIDCIGPAGVLVSVSDGSPQLPVHHQVELDAVGGRGMHLVDVLSVEWGIERGQRFLEQQDINVVGFGKGQNGVVPPSGMRTNGPAPCRGV